MSATLVLEKKVFSGVEDKGQQAVKISREVCSCGSVHMSTQNAVCRACSVAMEIRK